MIRIACFGKKLHSLADVHVCNSSGFHNTLSLKDMWAKKKSFKRKHKSHEHPPGFEVKESLYITYSRTLKDDLYN